MFVEFNRYIVREERARQCCQPFLWQLNNMTQITPLSTFLKSNWKMILLSSLVTKSLIFEANYPISLMIVAFLGYFSLKDYIDSKKAPDPSSELKQEVATLLAKIEKVNDKVGTLQINTMYKK